MNKTQKSIALALGGAFALSMAATTVNAAENPFALKTLSSGYQVADHHEEKMKDGKCGTGKCGAEKKAGEAKCSAEKAAEAKCSAEKVGEAKCSAEKMKEGTCSAEKK
ncbi:MAG: hypothetical protein CTY33_03070 [Methylotenera sp.]|nr:MAG: hypothetical protein CTY33_03070 [Methylotenera sp.]